MTCQVHRDAIEAAIRESAASGAFVSAETVVVILDELDRLRADNKVLRSTMAIVAGTLSETLREARVDDATITVSPWTYLAILQAMGADDERAYHQPATQGDPISDLDEARQSYRDLEEEARRNSEARPADYFDIPDPISDDALAAGEAFERAARKLGPPPKGAFTMGRLPHAPMTAEQTQGVGVRA